MAAELVETWDITNRINLYLLDAVPVEGLAAVAPTGGRPVGAQLAHMHSVSETIRRLVESGGRMPGSTSR